MTEISLYAGDNRDSLRRLIDQGARVHSVVTDPPYGLVSVQKRFGKEGAKPASSEKNDGSFARLSGGFMGKLWDGSGIERDPEFWSLIHDILLPGGYVFAFSGSRTGHWQAVAMELAGFIMHPMHGWVFGSGFPKPHNPRLEGWEGWAHGTQSQKPALEPIYLGQKPFSEKTGRANILMHGVGAVNLNGCRVPAPGEEISNHSRGADSAISKGKFGDSRAQETAGQVLGRNPSNLILDGSPEVVAMFPNGKSGKPGTRRKIASSHSMSGNLGLNDRLEVGYGDDGSAARFFHHFPPDIDPLIYHPKAGKACRAGSNHPTVKPIALMQYLVRHITPPRGLVLDPFAGSGTTAEAARREGFDCLLMEAEPEYIDFLRHRFMLPSAPVHQFADLLGDAMPMKSTVASQFTDLLG